MQPDQAERDALAARVKKMQIGGLTRHIFICIGPKCCSEEQGHASWARLKARIAEGNLGAKVYRTKVGCLRICMSGPIAVVYPEGVWYRNLTPEAVDRVVDEHLVNGRPVDELVFAVNPL